MSSSFVEYYRAKAQMKKETLTKEDEQFLVWMDQVENHLLKLSEGIWRITDICDHDYRMNFYDGMNPQVMAKIAFESEIYF